MAQNRLFIYDPKTKTATMIARGYCTGWASWSTKIEHINKFFEKAQEFTGDIDKTRYQLKTENDLPKDTEIFWEDDQPT